MGWLLGCFKCRQRRPTGSSTNVTASCKDGRRVSSTAGFSSANSAQAKESIEMERILSVKGDESKRNSSACIQTDRRSRSARRPSSEQLLQVEKLEEEIDNLNRKLAEEATQATCLTNEVRHLRSCSALLDSPNAFRKALNALEQALEKGHVEESQPLLYLQSLLSKIEPSEEVIETSSEERNEERLPKGFFECMDVSCLVTKKERKSVGKAHDKDKQVEPDQSQVSVFPPVTIPREPDEGQPLLPKDEQSTCNSRQQCTSDVVGIDAKKTPIIQAVTTLSFSGFLLVEDVTEERSTSDMAAVEQFSSTQFSVTKIIEKTDLSSENLTEASKSLFAFTTDSSQDTTSTAHALFGNISKDFSVPNSDSEVDSCSETREGNGSFFKLHYMSPTCMWSPQDANTHQMERVCCSLSTVQCQIDTNETSHNGFSDADALSLLSTSCSNSMDCISSSTLDSEESDSRHCTEASSRNVLLQMHITSVEDKVSAKEKVNLHATVQAFSVSQPEDIRSDAAAPLKVLDNSTSNEEDSRYTTSHMSSPSLSQGKFSRLGGEAIVELSSPGTTSIWSPDTETSPYAVQTFSPFRPGGGIKEGCPSDCLSETPSTPVSVNSHKLRLPLAKEDARKPQFTPVRTPIAAEAQAETSCSMRSRGSPSSLDEERPILGTVAAHWNHSSSASTQKWWDGKGIPNSTNKYKEDQKVSWHATPFEVRLERALAKQGRVFQKKLFTGAMATEMEVSM